MLTCDEIPRLQDGGIALCHGCQRKVYFAGGFFNLLIGMIEGLTSKHGSITAADKNYKNWLRRRSP